MHTYQECTALLDTFPYLMGLRDLDRSIAEQTKNQYLLDETSRLAKHCPRLQLITEEMTKVSVLVWKNKRPSARAAHA
jgi:hypothetical protein